MRKTKIVCTLGPASESREMIEKLVESGMNVARLNFSHGSYEEHKKKIDLVKQVSADKECPTAILLDTKGPEIRIKHFSEGKISLEKGDDFILTTSDVAGDRTRVSVTYANLANEVVAGNTILADDGLIKFNVEKVEGNDIHCTVENGGELSNNKSLNFPDVNIKLPAITQKDIDDIIFGINEDIDVIAASFVRKKEDVLSIRKVLEENGGEHIHIISKIENREGLNNIDEIIDVSDGIMVARGDLGVEVSPEEVPLAQKSIIKKCNQVGKPVITATQMLDSMIRNPRPTRAEVTDVANAIFDGTDAIMLSGETAAGKYPIEAVETMNRIALKTESSAEYLSKMTHLFTGEISVTNVISHATCSTAEQLNASAIVTATSSGHTARMVSKFRPKSPIIAITDDVRVQRKLSLVWGVKCLVTATFDNTDTLFDESLMIAVEKKLLNNGDLVVISAGVPLGVKGTTNLLKVQTIGNVLLRGNGIGKSGVTATARVARDEHQIFNEGDILVAENIDETMIEYVRKASGIITEEGGYTSQGAIAALQFKIPIVLGVDGATDSIADGSVITIDPQGGYIYQGKARVL
ncbi:pyruvate kinase [Alkalibacter mobilis]|uniref:pyruvate kinase n=1 Tax=Alkalibacter mobilis TaxID=2787712 RepID=UPI00189F97FD|nr:pyruvate kinase [Alkalibacter mobilis]MBF7095917.1 pyruvate kinase [Alkalibacter mobilis]